MFERLYKLCSEIDGLKHGKIKSFNLPTKYEKNIYRPMTV